MLSRYLLSIKDILQSNSYCENRKVEIDCCELTVKFESFTTIFFKSLFINIYQSKTSMKSRTSSKFSVCVKQTLQTVLMCKLAV